MSPRHGQCDHAWSVLLVRVGLVVPGVPKRRLLASAEQTCSICRGARKATVKEPLLASDTPTTVAVRAAGRAVESYLAMGPGQGWQRK